MSEDLNVKPKSNCPKCFGRGIVGLNVLTKRQVVCDCVMKRVVKNRIAAKKAAEKKLEQTPVSLEKLSIDPAKDAKDQQTPAEKE